MSLSGTKLFETQTAYSYYQVWETVYGGRPARVLYSGNGQAAQSGLALDDKSDLLFDYNQRLFELITGVRPKHILLIGGGMYTLPTALVGEFPDIIIEVIEIDAQLDAMASRFFNFSPGPRLHIQHTDGRRFLDTATTRYDMIIIDAYSHTSIPASLTDQAAARAVKRSLLPESLVVINTISSYFGERSETIKQVAIAYEAVFPKVDIYPASHGTSLWVPQNFLLIGQLKRQQLSQFLRYPPVSEVA